MFDFQKLNAYQSARNANKMALKLQNENKIPANLKDQWFRSALSVTANIAEGAGRWTPLDKRRFYLQARGSLFESVAHAEACLDIGAISEDECLQYIALCDDASRLLFGLVQSPTGKNNPMA